MREPIMIDCRRGTSHVLKDQLVTALLAVHDKLQEHHTIKQYL